MPSTKSIFVWALILQAGGVSQRERERGARQCKDNRQMQRGEQRQKEVCVEGGGGGGTERGREGWKQRQTSRERGGNQGEREAAQKGETKSTKQCYQRTDTEL